MKTENNSANNAANNAGAPIVWIDAEMTGLDPAVDELIEIAVIVTDGDLNPLDDGFDLVIKPTDKALEQMSDFVRNMHEESGLLPRLAEGVDLADAEAQVLEYLQGLVPEAGVGLLAGNSVGQDQRFLRAYMPQIAEHLHYRIIDVSSVKELAKRWHRDIYNGAPEKTGNHRALGDIQDSIAELQYYRETLFPPHGEDAPAAD